MQAEDYMFESTNDDTEGSITASLSVDFDDKGRHGAPPALIRWNSSAEMLFISIITLKVNFNLVTLTKGRNPLQLFLAAIFVSTPLTYMQMFLGKYSRQGIFQFSKIIPIMTGLGLTIVLCCFSYFCAMSVFSEQTLIYLILSLGWTLVWNTCEDPENVPCFDSALGCPGREPCWTEDRPLSTLLFSEKIFGYNRNYNSTIQLSLPELYTCWASLSVWLLIVALSLIRFVTVKKILKIIGIFLIIAQFLLMFNLLTKEPKMVFTEAYSLNFFDFVDWSKWCSSVTLVIYSLDLGNLRYVMFGVFSTSPRLGSLTFINSTLLFVNILVFHFILNSAFVLLVKVANLETINDVEELINTAPEDTTYLLVLSALASLDLPQIWTTLFLTKTLLAIVIHMVLTIHFLQKSLYQQIPHLIVYKKYIALSAAIAGTLCILIIQSPKAHPLIVLMQEMDIVYTYVNIVIISICVFYIYGIRTLADDLHFMEKVRPTTFWIICWTVLPILLLIVLVFVMGGFMNSNNGHVRIILFTITYLPFLIVTAIVMMKLIRARNLVGILMKSIDFGPIDPDKRERRQRFNPGSQMKCEIIDYDCKHNCLRNNKLLKRMIMDEDRLYYDNMKGWNDDDSLKTTGETHLYMSLRSTEGFSRN